MELSTQHVASSAICINPMGTSLWRVRLILIAALVLVTEYVGFTLTFLSEIQNNIVRFVLNYRVYFYLK